ncbi:MAG: virulence factor SrfB, partial [Rhodospirillaceae bacterium]
MSSPKRYLWDDTQRQDGWRFNNPDARDQAVYATGAEFTTLVNDRGEPLHLLPREEEGVMDDRHFPAMRALYARTHLMTFALSEVFLQAMGMMNAPFHRLRRRNAELPRRLRRIVMTMPTGMPLAERQRLVKRAEAARDLVYLCAGLAEPETDPDALQALRPVNSDQPLPEIRIEWDEASATQAAFLYSRIAEAHGGDAQAYFQAMRSPLRSGSGPGSGAKEGLRIATLDVGGGTTDLAITAYHGEGQGAHVTLFPDPILREGISLAGDDILQQVIVEHVLDPLRAALRAEGFGDRADVIIDQLFGGDRGDMSVAEQMRRQRFTLQIGTPLALAMVAVYEQWDRLDGGPEPFGVTIEEALRGTQDNALIAELEAEISKLGGGLTFDLKAVRFPVHAPDLDRTARSVMGDVLKAFAELVRRHQVDLLILSGRPSRMPAIFDVIAESCALPPNRILPLHRFRVGTWYPFRDFEARIADPKTTAAVGAMVCLLGGSGRLRNFNYRSEKLSVSSTARYFGKLDQDNRLKADNVFYAEMNLDNPDYELPGTAFEFRGPMYLGTRQFKADWWPGTRLYALDYASAEAAAQLTGRTPLKIELKRASGREAKGVPDIFAISRIEDAEGRTVGR